MGEISTRTRERAVLDLRAGGQIPLPVIDAFTAEGIRELFRLTRMLVVEMDKIDEVKDENTYVLPELQTGIYCELAALYRVTLDDAGDIATKQLINPNCYVQELVVDPLNVAEPFEAIILSQKSGRDYTDGLFPLAVVAYEDEAYIPRRHFIDALDAIPAYVLSVLANQTGKPWSDKNEAIIQRAEFTNAMSRIRNLALRGGTRRRPAMKPTQSFT